ncbi:MAG: substrate-binding domain-containing protein [bacterium]|nr:substrate-binding domain-containing protein [bacterium]
MACRRLAARLSSQGCQSILAANRLFAAVLAVTLLAVLPGCGDEEEVVADVEPASEQGPASASESAPSANESASGQVTASTPESVSGQLWLYGSWQTARLSGIVADLFQQRHPGVTTTGDSPSISEWELLCRKRFEFIEGSGLMTADHRIPDWVAENCEAGGIEWVELPVAVEAIAVIADEDSPLECVSLADFYAVVGPESAGFETWADVRALASELGSATAFPDGPLSVYGPVRGPTVHNSLNNYFLADLAEERGYVPAVRRDFHAEEDFEAIVDGIRATDSGFGWVDYTTAANAEGVKLLEVDDGSGCTVANPETIAAGRYPLSRTIYLYVDKARAASQPQVSAFVDFYLTDHGLETAVDKLEYLSLTEDAKAATRATWANR